MLKIGIHLMIDLLMEFNPVEIDVILYHSNCPDGIGAAWPIWRELKGNVITKAVRHGEPYPSEIQNRRVAIVDFSYNRPTMKEICSKAKFVTVIDHHKSAIRELNGLENEIENYRGFFDIDRSGAQIVWDLIHPIEGGDSYSKIVQRSRPWFIEIIADRDLWKWELRHSKYIGAALYQREWYTFFMMDWMYDISLPNVDRIPVQLEKELVSEGKMIETREKKDIDYAVGTAVMCMFEDYMVKLTTCHPTLRSEVGNILSSKDCDFAAIWRYDFPSDQWWISLRAREDSIIDLSRICEKYGGGGHAKACGFTIHGPKSPKYSDDNVAKGTKGLHSYFKQVR